MQEDFQNSATRTSPPGPAFVLEINLLTSMCDFVPCDDILQRVYWLWSFKFTCDSIMEHVAKRCKTKAKLKLLDTQVQNALGNISKNNRNSTFNLPKVGRLHSCEILELSFIGTWYSSNNVNHINRYIRHPIQCWHLKSNYVTKYEIKILGITAHQEE